MKKRFLSILLTLTMVLTMLPTTALAENVSTNTSNKSTITFEIVNGTWGDQKTSISFPTYYASSLNGYVLECGGPAESLLEDILGSSNINNIIPNPGYYAAGQSWAITSGGIIGGGTVAQQLNALKGGGGYGGHGGHMGYHDYDTTDPKGAFAADTVYTITLLPIKYTVTYNLAGGTVDVNVNDDIIYYYPGAGTPDTFTVSTVTPEKTGYKFVGWSLKGVGSVTAGKLISVKDYWDNTSVVGTVTDGTGVFELTALWEEVYTVTFKDWDGTILKTQEVAPGDDATAPVNPSRDGYNFTGWDKAYNNITADTVVTALYTIKTYTVTFQDWDGTVLKTETVEHGGAATAPADPSRTGYTFTSWDVAFDNVTADITVTAQYEINKYTVTYTINGEYYDEAEFEYGAAVTAPEYEVPEGYSFRTWLVVSKMPAKDLILKATLTVNNYTITYNLADGALAEGVTNPTTYTVESETITLNNPTRDGYVFVGWTGTGLTEETMTVKIEKGSIGDRAYTANWEEDDQGKLEGGQETGDGIADKYQAFVWFKPANTNGTVTTKEGAAENTGVYQVYTFANEATSGDVTPTLSGVVVTPMTGYAFDIWTKDQGTENIDPTTTLTNVSGNATINFIAHFDTDTKGNPEGGGDGIPDKYQVFVEYVTDGNGTLEGTTYKAYDLREEATVALTFPTPKANTNYVFDKWINPDDVTVSENELKGYTAGETYTFTATFATDNWKDSPNGDSTTGGDGIADKYQVLIKYVAKDDKGTVAPTIQVETLGEVKTKAITLKSNATAREGCHFSRWTDSQGVQVSSNANLNKSFTVEAGETYIITANFNIDTYAPVAPVPTVTIKGLNDIDHVAYVVGYGNDDFRPMGSVTRAEVATVYFRLMTEEFRTQFWSNENSFSDVADTAWYNVAISTLENAGIIKDTLVGGKFRPDAPITRAELAVMAAQFANVTGKVPAASFKDVDKDHWAAEEIAIVELAGWIEGYMGNYRPDDNLTRAEFVTIVNRMLKRGAEAENMLDDMVTFVDNIYGAWYYEAVQEAANSHDYIRTSALLEGEKFTGEKWTVLLDAPDWAALEKAWAEMNQ